MFYVVGNNNKEKKMKEENALSAAPNQALPFVKNNIQKNDKPKVYYVDFIIAAPTGQCNA